MATGVRDLKLWQEAVALAGDVLRAARQHGRKDLPWFVDELAGTATSVAISIADGYSRGEALDQQRVFEQARRSLVAFDTHLAVAKHAGALAPAALAALTTRAATVSRLLTGFLTFIERQESAEREDGTRRISPAASSSPLRKALDEIYCA